VIFVDTGAWFARFVPDDPSHERIKTWFAANNEPLVTSDYCVDETLTLLAARKRVKVSIEAGRLLLEEAIARLHFVTPQQVHRSWILFQSRAYAGWSFTGCTSKIVIDDLNVETAIAVDDHFRQFGITVIP